MKLILSLLKKILVSLSDFYRKDYVNAELDKRVDSTVFTSSLGGETAERKRVDLEISASIDDNEANDEALAKVIEWQGYVDQICRSVDDDVAIAFAEEFEKATVEYLADPTATKSWITTKDENYQATSTNPYFGTIASRPIVDFNVSVVEGQSTYGISSSFSSEQNVSVLFPNARSVKCIFAYSKINSPVILPIATNAYCSFMGTSLFNQFVYLPSATYCVNAFRGARSFNKNLHLPEATNCSYLLYEATSFNQPVHLPKATNVTHVFHSATSYDQPIDFPSAVSATAMCQMAYAFNSSISLPKATVCDYLLHTARKFNQVLNLPVAENCNLALTNATSFNNTINIPKATTCRSILSGATSFNQHVDLPSCTDASSAFNNTALSSENIRSILMTLPEHTDGAEHVISFVGTPGSAEIDENTSEVALAHERGWTVEL